MKRESKTPRWIQPSYSSTLHKQSHALHLLKPAQQLHLVLDIFHFPFQLRLAQRGESKFSPWVSCFVWRYYTDGWLSLSWMSVQMLWWAWRQTCLCRMVPTSQTGSPQTSVVCLWSGSLHLDPCRNRVCNSLPYYSPVCSSFAFGSFYRSNNFIALMISWPYIIIDYRASIVLKSPIFCKFTPLSSAMMDLLPDSEPGNENLPVLFCSLHFSRVLEHAAPGIT